ncbi:MAG: AlpA family phage regulatory protein [Pseudomonadaceae bacterium]|nr:AlpA family phage regulatory protein [Pseudomonadaceae bacterium]
MEVLIGYSEKTTDLPRKELLQVDEVAAKCGISKSSVWRLMREKKFPQRHKIGRMARWRLSDLEAWLNNPSEWTEEQK